MSDREFGGKFTWFFPLACVLSLVISIFGRPFEKERRGCLFIVFTFEGAWKSKIVSDNEHGIELEVSS